MFFVYLAHSLWEIMFIAVFHAKVALRENCPIFGVFLVHIFPHLGWIWSISPYSVQMRENTEHKNSEHGHFSRNALNKYFFSKTDFRESFDISKLKHFSPMFHFCTHEKVIKPKVFFTFSGGKEIEHWDKMD